MAVNRFEQVDEPQADAITLSLSARGGEAYGFKLGTSYSDVGTPSGYREASEALKQHASCEPMSGVSDDLVELRSP